MRLSCLRNSVEIGRLQNPSEPQPDAKNVIVELARELITWRLHHTTRHEMIGGLIVAEAFYVRSSIALIKRSLSLRLGLLKFMTINLCLT